MVRAPRRVRRSVVAVSGAVVGPAVAAAAVAGVAVTNTPVTRVPTMGTQLAGFTTTRAIRRSDPRWAFRARPPPPESSPARRAGPTCLAAREEGG